VVSTYRRVDSLIRCLEGLRAQTRAPDEVIVVVHVSDQESARLVEATTTSWPELRRALVEIDGSVASYNRGLAAARGAIVAYIDDDAVPAPDWLVRIVDTFAQDERIAAVGGRDVIVADGGVIGRGRQRFRSRRTTRLEVGRIQWFGRMIANHHLGTGAARDVDVLKGVNMSFRRVAVAAHGFDGRLRGRGAQVHSELSICLPLRRRGLRVVYDPGIVVTHFPAARPHGDERDDVGRRSVSDSAHNEALAILDYFGPTRRIVFAVWGLAVGTTGAPGAAVLLRDLVGGTAGAWTRFGAAQHGRAAAWKTRRTGRRAPAGPVGARSARTRPV
jgi:GT2 family glycosyltransferase